MRGDIFNDISSKDLIQSISNDKKSNVNDFNDVNDEEDEVDDSNTDNKNDVLPIKYLPKPLQILTPIEKMKLHL